MGYSQFVAFVLVSTLLVLFSTAGYGKKVLVDTDDAFPPMIQEMSKSRKRVTEEVALMDYGTENVGPNVNSKSGFPFNNLPPPMPPLQPSTSD
ncbi:unnamed protein product [Amaranthus hypochondriacus]